MYLPFSYSLLASHKRQNGRIDLADQDYKFSRITPPSLIFDTLWEKNNVSPNSAIKKNLKTLLGGNILSKGGEIIFKKIYTPVRLLNKVNI